MASPSFSARDGLQRRSGSRRRCLGPAQAHADLLKSGPLGQQGTRGAAGEHLVCK
jgi:hypothetical protein